MTKISLFFFFSSTGADECADVCYPSGLPAGTTISDCVLTFTGVTPGTWYAISLQVNDSFQFV